MTDSVTVKTVLKRGALVAAANWQVTAIQFVADTTFKMLLSVPLVGGVMLVVLVLGRELPEVFTGDLRGSMTFVATALSAEPVALASFLLAFSLVGLAGSALLFLLKGRRRGRAGSGRARGGPGRGAAAAPEALLDGRPVHR